MITNKLWKIKDSNDECFGQINAILFQLQMISKSYELSLRRHGISGYCKKKLQELKR